MAKPTEDKWMCCQARTIKEAVAELEASITSSTDARVRNVLSIWEQRLDRDTWPVALTQLFKLYPGNYHDLAEVCSKHLHKILLSDADTLYVMAWTLGYFARRMEDEDQS